MAETLDFDLDKDFSQGARYLARLQIASKDVFPKPLVLLFPMTLILFTFYNLFPTYPTLYPTSWMENTKVAPPCLYSARVPDPWPVLDLAELMFF